MYKSFYKLSERPFQISSDPRFLWLGTKHSEALAVLKYGLIGEKGFLLLTGDVGAGKTTLVNTLLKTLDNTVLVANITDPGLDLIGFLNHITLSFNLQQRFNRKEEFLIYFRGFLQKTCLHNGKKALLIIDEAHKLSKELLEQIRLLSNIELPEKKLINIFFVGQNELNQKLLSHDEANQKEIKTLYIRVIRDQAALLLTKDTDQTEKLLQKAVKTDPQNAMTYYDLGKLYSQTKDHLKAINAYEKAADLNPNSANTFFNLGFTYAAIKNYVHAEQMFFRVTDLEPPYLDKAIVNLALVQYKQGKKLQCIENLRKALKENPDNQKAHKYLEQFTAVSGE